ncbi:hypothetical protein CVT26_007559 [Gymnopilus dilepis]|uniref:Elongation factor methyltransferase 7 n=1 Tax=Gymnopilus dilepis TaxID=231916 RepID=A0A409W868_9AGAR|nr:hypothetical protein CVT26_007559 [Gymnopilus dilepis]
MIASSIALSLAAIPAAFAATFTVQVGAGGKLAYDPEFVLANPGDTINFVFNPKNHTVTQSSFNTPCVALPDGATTGFVPVAAGTTPLPTRQFVVPNTNGPLWFYCQQTGHCGQGMVFAINPPADPDPHSFSAFQALAIAQNGTSTSSSTSSASSSSTSAFVTPPPPQWQSATATVTFDGSVYTTTYTSYDGTPPPTPAANPVDHKITVGANGELSYNPPNITANIGDTVTFEFHPKNHTVTQSSFLHPCEALQETSDSPGFKSGFQPVSANQTDFPTFQIKINDTAPIWGYCGQTGHCAAGMVFAINAVESGPNNFENFLALAKQSGNSSSDSSGSGSATTTAPGSKNTNAAASSHVGPSKGKHGKTPVFFAHPRRRTHKMSSEDDETYNLDEVFEVSKHACLLNGIAPTEKEPPRPPTPEPTVATYTRDAQNLPSDESWREIRIRLVGSHPLWAHYLWNAALALASYLDSNRDIYFNRNVLELGAGGSLPSIVAAKNGARKVVITDYPDSVLLENISHNVSENVEKEKLGRVDGYIWGQPVDRVLGALPIDDPHRKFHLVILSDLIFNHSQHDALLKTCEAVLVEKVPDGGRDDPCVLVFYSHHRPHLAHRDMEFFKKAEDRGWACEEIITKIFPPMFPEDPGEELIRSTVHGWRLTRRG